jgi:hypothetical protein
MPTTSTTGPRAPQEYSAGVHQDWLDDLNSEYGTNVQMAGGMFDRAAKRRTRRRARRKKRNRERDQQADEQREIAEGLMAENLEDARRIYAEGSALDELAADPLLVAAQERALGELEARGQTGWSDLDRQALDQAYMQSRREEQAQRDAVMLDAQRRGDTRGSNTLLASLVAQQDGANRSAQRSTDLAVEGRDRALEAIINAGNMAGTMRDQRFNEGATVGSAQDAFRSWATGNLTDARNQSTQYALAREATIRGKKAAKIAQVLGYVGQLGEGVADLIPTGGAGRTAAPTPGAAPVRSQFAPPQPPSAPSGASGKMSAPTGLAGNPAAQPTMRKPLRPVRKAQGF